MTKKLLNKSLNEVLAAVNGGYIVKYDVKIDPVQLR